MKENHNPEGGELQGKGVYLQQTKLSKSQYERLRMLAEQFGFTTVSAYIRFMTLNPALQATVNDIKRKVDLLFLKQGGLDEEKNGKRK
ncbi:hypothetical protein HYW76_02520 [Candidatus Pacearchaeota archaeon]|nr:hypothetical protein [Candidatus Pacearchaeota archaeon]